MILKDASVGSMVEKGAEDKATGNVLSPQKLQNDKIHHKEGSFNIMDWLEKIIPKDLEVAQQLITPNKEVSKEVAPEADTKQSLQAVSQALFAPAAPSDSSGTATTREEHGFYYKKSVTIGNAWNAKGLQKAQRDQWPEALLCWQNALEVRLQILGKDHLDVANTYNNIGIAQGKLGCYTDAITALHRAQEIRQQQLGQHHHAVAATLHNIGNVHQQAGNYLEAVKHYQQAKQIQQAHLGSDHVQVARADVAIGHAYAQAGQLDNAWSAYQDAKASFDRAGVAQDNDEMMDLMEDIKDVSAELEGSA